MKSRKANILPSETLKIVLGVIGIALLAYLLFALYSSNVKERKLVEAKNTIEIISKHVAQIKKNSSYVASMTEITPVKWSIFSFTSNQIKPNQCSGQDCLCICDDVYDMNWLMENRQEKECSKNGACLRIKSLMKFDQIDITRNPFTSIRISGSGKWVEVKKI